MAVKLQFPKGHIAEVVAAVLVPIFAAFVRSVIGAKQIREIFAGALPALRQVALAIAIILLILFESSVAMFTFTDDEPMLAWLAAVGFYLGYLASVAFAFRPAPSQTP